MLRLALYRTPASSSPAGGGAATVVAGLPKPSEGEPIPAAHEGGVSTPDNSIYTVWTSPTEHHLVFVHPGDAERYTVLHRRMDELAANLPDRRGSPSLAHRLNQASRWFPPPVLWLGVAVIALIFRRPRETIALLVPTVAGLIVIVVSALGLPAEPHYSVPVAPAFVMLASGALFARRGAPAWRAVVAAMRPLVGAALGVVASVSAVAHYVRGVRGAYEVNGAPHDLSVFLSAAAKVLHLASPYVFRADETYAYPPLLAFLVSPLHPLGAGAVTVVWTVISLAGIGGALWLLGVRDWRCYALTAVYPFTRSAVDLGTVAPLLLLAVAAAWRWRDRVIEPALALGTSVALKLFLWPLVLWLVLTRRFRPAIAVVAFAVMLVVLPWAALGFAGMGGYPGLLRHLSDDEASSSYSIIALAVRAHLPEGVGVVLSVFVAVGLIALAVWIALDQRRSFRVRDVAVLTLVLTAALAASPIVWVHYFLLLLVPLALTQPRLSVLWLVPFAYYPLGESAWPAGDGRKLGIALAATLLILAGSLVTVLRGPRQPALGAASPPGTRRFLLRMRSETRPG